MCSECILVPIPDHIWAGGIFDFDPTHPEYGIDSEGRRCLNLDACIVPAVQVLWAAGIVTLSCCCGHGNAWGVITIQSKEIPGLRGAMQLRRERYEELLAAEQRLAAAEAERDGLRAALETIRRDYGRVCSEYELCHHAACESSIGAWMEADQALAAWRRAVAGGTASP